MSERWILLDGFVVSLGEFCQFDFELFHSGDETADWRETSLISSAFLVYFNFVPAPAFMRPIPALPRLCAIL